MSSSLLYRCFRPLRPGQQCEEAKRPFHKYRGCGGYLQHSKPLCAKQLSHESVLLTRRSDQTRCSQLDPTRGFGSPMRLTHTNSSPSRVRSAFHGLVCRSAPSRSTPGDCARGGRPVSARRASGGTAYNAAHGHAKPSVNRGGPGS